MKKIMKKIFSIQNINNHKEIILLGFKIKFKRNNFQELEKNISELNYIVQQLNKRDDNIHNIVMSLYLKTNYFENNKKKFYPNKIFEQVCFPLNNCYFDSNISYLEYCFPNLQGNFNSLLPREKEPDFFYVCGIGGCETATETISFALKRNKPVYIIEDCFLRSIFSHVWDVDLKYKKSIGFTFDDITHYIDSSLPSRLEQMLNDENLIVTDEQKQRARNCINRILETHLSKYNNQPIFEPKIGREGAKKVLVVDQSYGDWSITKGGGSEELFKIMLEKAIKANPNADIIVKTHPDTMSGTRGGYYTDLKQHDNVYPMTEPINPISLIKYVDKVYVCTTQLGFEALMCGKEVHTFGIPFYSGWGLTIDEQKCERRTNKRTLEEVFYIAYIMYSHYVNPDKKCKCEIEEAMDYLLKLRDEYFKETNNEIN